MTALSSGGLGDIVYSIPVMKTLGVTTLYAKLNYYAAPYGTVYSSIKRLVEHEGIKVEPYPCTSMFKYEGMVDYDIDRFRLERLRGKVHIQANMCKAARIPVIPYKPWLSLPVSDQGYNVIQLTPRWRRNSRVDWKRIVHEMDRPAKFLGFQHEWVEFCDRYGNVPWCPTVDVYDMAEVIAGASAVYCNQGVSLTIAQGLGKEYNLEVNKGKTNTLFYGSNEHLL